MKEKGWKEIPIGGKIIDAGNASEYKTGDWKTFRPEIDRSECINCLFCWMYCPDMAFTVKDNGDLGDIFYEYCKGCGICAEICPKKCIHMEKEQR
jgi:pyruvate ferredoxin oxidoreductase delta subunit